MASSLLLARGGFSAYLEGIASRAMWKFTFPTHPLSPLSDKGISYAMAFVAWLLALQASCLSTATSELSSNRSWSHLSQAGLMQLTQRLHTSLPFLPRGRPAPVLA